MWRVDAAILGARAHYAVPRILAKAGRLGTFFTDIYVGNKRWWPSLERAIPARIAPSAFARVCGRRCDEIPAHQVVSFDLFGARALSRHRSRRTRAALYTSYAEVNREFCIRVISRGLHGDAIYGCNGASLEMFEFARAHGLKCILEQTICPGRIEERLLAEEKLRWPGWEPRLDDVAAPTALIEREERELALADSILCGSEFVVDGVRAITGDRVHRMRVIPYGVELPEPLGARPEFGHRELNLLFAGEVSLRKGVPYLLEALRMLSPGPINARLVGRVRLDPEPLAQYANLVEFGGHLSRAAMKEAYRWADIMVLPSICEGSALVTYEALAAGVPVITTRNSGSVVRDGKDGFVVPIRDAAALAEKIERLVHDRTLLAEMSLSARARAAEMDLARYSDNLLAAIDSVILDDPGEALGDLGETAPSSDAQTTAGRQE